MKILNFKIGTCYVVRFLDHTHGIDELVNVEIVGWCSAVKDKHVVFSAWRVDDKDEDMISNNTEPVSIVKSCITHKRAIYIPKLGKE